MGASGWEAWVAVASNPVFETTHLKVFRLPLELRSGGSARLRTALTVSWGGGGPRLAGQEKALRDLASGLGRDQRRIVENQLASLQRLIEDEHLGVGDPGSAPTILIFDGPQAAASHPAAEGSPALIALNAALLGANQPEAAGEALEAAELAVLLELAVRHEARHLADPEAEESEVLGAQRLWLEALAEPDHGHLIAALTKVEVPYAGLRPLLAFVEAARAERQRESAVHQAIAQLDTVSPAPCRATTTELGTELPFGKYFAATVRPALQPVKPITSPGQLIGLVWTLPAAAVELLMLSLSAIRYRAARRSIASRGEPVGKFLRSWRRRKPHSGFRAARTAVTALLLAYGLISIEPDIAFRIVHHPGAILFIATHHTADVEEPAIDELWRQRAYDALERAAEVEALRDRVLSSAAGRLTPDVALPVQAEAAKLLLDAFERRPADLGDAVVGEVLGSQVLTQHRGLRRRARELVVGYAVGADIEDGVRALAIGQLGRFATEEWQGELRALLWDQPQTVAPEPVVASLDRLSRHLAAAPDPTSKKLSATIAVRLLELSPETEIGTAARQRLLAAEPAVFDEVTAGLRRLADRGRLTGLPRSHLAVAASLLTLARDAASEVTLEELLATGSGGAGPPDWRPAVEAAVRSSALSLIDGGQPEDQTRGYAWLRALAQLERSTVYYRVLEDLVSRLESADRVASETALMSALVRPDGKLHPETARRLADPDERARLLALLTSRDDVPFIEPVARRIVHSADAAQLDRVLVLLDRGLRATPEEAIGVSVALLEVLATAEAPPPEPVSQVIETILKRLFDLGFSGIPSLERQAAEAFEARREVEVLPVLREAMLYGDPAERARATPLLKARLGASTFRYSRDWRREVVSDPSGGESFRRQLLPELTALLSQTQDRDLKLRILDDEFWRLFTSSGDRATLEGLFCSIRIAALDASGPRVQARATARLVEFLDYPLPLVCDRDDQYSIFLEATEPAEALFDLARSPHAEARLAAGRRLLGELADPSYLAKERHPGTEPPEDRLARLGAEWLGGDDPDERRVVLEALAAVPPEACAPDPEDAALAARLWPAALRAMAADRSGLPTPPLVALLPSTEQVDPRVFGDAVERLAAGGRESHRRLNALLPFWLASPHQPLRHAAAEAVPGLLDRLERDPDEGFQPLSRLSTISLLAQSPARLKRLRGVDIDPYYPLWNGPDWRTIDAFFADDLERIAPEDLDELPAAMRIAGLIAGADSAGTTEAVDYRLLAPPRNAPDGRRAFTPLDELRTLAALRLAPWGNPELAGHLPGLIEASTRWSSDLGPEVEDFAAAAVIEAASVWSASCFRCQPSDIVPVLDALLDAASDPGGVQRGAALGALARTLRDSSELARTWKPTGGADVLDLDESATARAALRSLLNSALPARNSGLLSIVTRGFDGWDAYTTWGPKRLVASLLRMVARAGKDAAAGEPGPEANNGTEFEAELGTSLLEWTSGYPAEPVRDHLDSLLIEAFLRWRSEPMWKALEDSSRLSLSNRRHTPLLLETLAVSVATSPWSDDPLDFAGEKALGLLRIPDLLADYRLPEPGRYTWTPDLTPDFFVLLHHPRIGERLGGYWVEHYATDSEASDDVRVAFERFQIREELLSRIFAGTTAERLEGAIAFLDSFELPPLLTSKVPQSGVLRLTGDLLPPSCSAVFAARDQGWWHEAFWACGVAMVETGNRDEIRRLGWRLLNATTPMAFGQENLVAALEEAAAAEVGRLRDVGALRGALHVLGHSADPAAAQTRRRLQDWMQELREADSGHDSGIMR